MAEEMKSFVYRNQGTCSRAVKFSLDDEGRLHKVQFVGGCDGNTNGISKLVEGMDAAEVSDRLMGTTCGIKTTSCPDQLAKALREAMQEQ